MTTNRKVTLEQFKYAHNRSGESVMDLAFDALNVTNDPGFVAAAQAAITAVRTRFLPP